MGQEDAQQRVEAIQVDVPRRAVVQQGEQQHNLLFPQVRRVTENAITLQVWRAVSSQASSAQSCEQQFVGFILV